MLITLYSSYLTYIRRRKEPTYYILILEIKLISFNAFQYIDMNILFLLYSSRGINPMTVLLFMIESVHSFAMKTELTQTEVRIQHHVFHNEDTISRISRNAMENVLFDLS